MEGCVGQLEGQRAANQRLCSTYARWVKRGGVFVVCCSLAEQSTWRGGAGRRYCAGVCLFAPVLLGSVPLCREKKMLCCVCEEGRDE